MLVDPEGCAVFPPLFEPYWSRIETFVDINFRGGIVPADTTVAFVSECMLDEYGMSVGVVVDDFPGRICVGVLPALYDWKGGAGTYEDSIGNRGASESGVGACRHLIDIVAVFGKVFILERKLLEIVGQQFPAGLTYYSITQAAAVEPSAAASELRSLPVEHHQARVGVVLHIEVIWRARVIDADEGADFRGIALSRTVGHDYPVGVDTRSGGGVNPGHPRSRRDILTDGFSQSAVFEYLYI